MTGDARDEFRLLKALKVLGLKPGCSGAELKQAYRRLCKVWHPDRFASDPDLQNEANSRLAEINSAYEYAAPIIDRQDAARRQAEEGARQQRTAQQGEAPEETGRTRDSAGSKAEKDKREFERRVEERAEQLAEQRSRRYRRRLIAVVGLLALVAFAVGSTSLESYANAVYTDGYSAGERAGSEAAEQAARSRETDAYSRGLEAGKVAAQPSGKYIRMDHPSYTYDANFQACSANTWYVISISENPDTADRSFAPYVVDAYFTTGETGSARQIRTSSLPSSWWSYTTMEKK